MAISLHRETEPHSLAREPAVLRPVSPEAVGGPHHNQSAFTTSQTPATAPGATSALFQHLTDGSAAAAAGVRATTPAGNQRQGAGDTMTDHIARSIAVYETNRGGTQPIAKESSLDTTAGNHASVRSVSQATVPWIIDALEQHPELRQNASQPVTEAEVAAAHQRMTTTDSILREVDGAGRQTAEQFAQAHAAQLRASGFEQADIARMMESRDLHAKILAASRRVHALPARQQKDAIQREIAAIPVEQRVGLGAGSMSSYIRTPGNWGENRAGWERESIERMPGGAGHRIIETATHNEGLTMMGAVMNSQVSAQQRAHPGNPDAVVRGVAASHNSAAAYPAGVLDTYHRLYPR